MRAAPTENQRPDLRRRWHKGMRYYEAEACIDLFGTRCVRVAWGRIGTAYGRQLTRPYDGDAAVALALARIARRRTQRGYHLVAGDVA